MAKSLKDKLFNMIGKGESKHKSFKENTILFWTEFESKESIIRQIMTDKADANTLVKTMSELLELAFNDLPFEMGINDENKHELILSPNGNKILLIQILYFLKYKPERLDQYWNFYSTKPAQGHDGLTLNIYDINITADDFLIYANLDEEKKIIHLEVFVPILHELKDNDKYNALFIMLDLFLGELYTMEYIGHINIIDDKKADEFEPIPLSKMKAYIDYLVNEHEWKKAEPLAQNYTTYRFEGSKTSKELRRDVFLGYTSCFDIIRNLNSDEIYPIRDLDKDGVYVGYIHYNNSTIPQEMIIEHRAEIEDAIGELLGNKGIADPIGGATGYNNTYIDFIVYDLGVFLRVAKIVMDKYNYANKGFSFFNPDRESTFF